MDAKQHEPPAGPQSASQTRRVPSWTPPTAELLWELPHMPRCPPPPPPMPVSSAPCGTKHSQPQTRCSGTHTHPQGEERGHRQGAHQAIPTPGTSPASRVFERAPEGRCSTHTHLRRAAPSWAVTGVCAGKRTWCHTACRCCGSSEVTSSEQHLGAPCWPSCVPSPLCPPLPPCASSPTA